MLPRLRRAAAVRIRALQVADNHSLLTEAVGEIVGRGRRGRSVPRHPNHLGRELDGGCRRIRRIRPARIFCRRTIVEIRRLIGVITDEEHLSAAQLRVGVVAVRSPPLGLRYPSVTRSRRGGRPSSI